MSTAPAHSGSMLLQDYIRLAASIEDAVASIYEGFGHLFKDNVEFSHFWRLSAEAERYHAATIRLYEAILPGDVLVDADRLPIDIADGRRLLEQLQVITGRCSENPPTPQEALDIASTIEDDGAEVHGRTQFESWYADLGDLFKQLAEEDRAHRTTFEYARTRFKDLH